MKPIQRFFQSRGMRKLLRNKLAVASLVVIGFYFMVGLFVLCGGLTKDACSTVVAARNLPGFFFQPKPEARYEIATTDIFSDVKRALGRDNPAESLKEIQLGQYQVVDKSPEELEAIIEQANVLMDKLKSSENLDVDPDMWPTLEKLESKTAELVAPLTGWSRFIQNAAVCLGTDAQGRSIFFRAVYSIKVALLIGVVVAAFSVIVGALLGAAAGYFGGWVDHLVNWVFSVFSSIPGLVLLVVIAYAFTDFDVNLFGTEFKLGKSLFPVYVALGMTFWVGTCRVIRGETMKLKQLEYVQAARTAGFGSFRILTRHVLPNTAHLMLINFSLLLIGAIKSEVILSYLGLGVKDQPSWGIMIRDAGANGDVISGFFWQIGTATVFMFVLVLAFNILSDALQDAFDPKHL